MTDPETSSDDESTILEDGGVDTDERAGRSLGIKPDEEPDEDTKQEMEEERERRLYPENRPDGAEVDNTQRTFDTEAGKFTDADDFDEDDKPFADPENPNTGKGDDEDDADEDDDDADDDDAEDRS